MKGTVRGGTVPLVISYRKVTKKPEVQRTRRFVGWKRMLANVAIKAIEAIEDIAYETETEVLDAGEQQVVHWAICVEDPWGLNDQSTLTAQRLPDKPAAGVALEVVRIIEKDSEVPFKGAEPRGAVAPRRPDHEKIRERFRAQLKKDGHYDPEIGPETIDDAFDDAFDEVA